MYVHQRLCAPPPTLDGKVNTNRLQYDMAKYIMKVETSFAEFYCLLIHYNTHKYTFECGGGKKKVIQNIYFCHCHISSFS